MSETLYTEDGRTVLRMERRLAHPPEKVWRAITDPDHNARWFPARMVMEPAVGAKVGYDWGDGAGPVVDGVVTEYDPPHVLAHTWGGELLRWEIRPLAEGSLLILTHAFDDRYGAPSFAAGWQTCCDALAQVLDGRPVDVPGPSAELLDAYVARFALDEGEAERTAEGWRVRFERQLARPAEEVWEVLTDPVPPVIGAPAPPAVAVPVAPAGVVTSVRRHELLEYGWLSGGRRAGTVRWELRPGTGHGARLVVTQTGLHSPDTALAVLRDHLSELVTRLHS